MNIALVCAWSLAPASPGFYLGRALARLGHAVRYVGPGCEVNTRRQNPYVEFDFARFLQRNEIDLVIEVESGGLELQWVPTSSLRQITQFVYWGSDTHIPGSFRPQKGKSRHYHQAYFAQWNFVRKVPTVKWLPHAFDPQFHCPPMEDETKIHDVTFVGHQHKVHTARRRLLDRLRPKFNMNIRAGLYLEKMGLEYRRSKIVFNKALSNDLNMRFFEALGSGACLVTDWITHAGFAEIGLVRGQHFIAYDNAEQAEKALTALLQDDVRRERVAATGHAWAMAGHTYDHRAKTILESL